MPVDLSAPTCSAISRQGSHATTTRRPLEGQRALVTGGSSGIGAGIARRLAEAGAAVVVNYGRDANGANAVVEDIISHGGDAIAIQADVSKDEQVERMFAQAVSRYGSLDIVVCNAGLQRDAPLQDMSLEDWEYVLSVNLTGTFLAARSAVREFMRRGMDPQRSRALGKILCISSVHDRIPWAGHANYAASKGGVMLLMQTMAQELAMHRIRVNSISPGAIKTPINTSAWNTPDAEAELLKLIPYGRVGETRDIANAAVWLASDEADYVTGATLYVDGGMTLYPGFERGG